MKGNILMKIYVRQQEYMYQKGNVFITSSGKGNGNSTVPTCWDLFEALSSPLHHPYFHY